MSSTKGPGTGAHSNFLIFLPLNVQGFGLAEKQQRKKSKQRILKLLLSFTEFLVFWILNEATSLG